MEENVDRTSEVFMEITRKKVDDQEKKIMAIEERIRRDNVNPVLLEELKKSFDSIKEQIKSSGFVADKMQLFSDKLEEGMRILQRPIQNNMTVKHHVPKIIWLSVGLFLSLCLVCSGWYVTGSKLDGYIANDTKYRRLRLDTSNRSLQNYLYSLDSLYNANADMRKSVLETEEQDRQNFERLKQAALLKAQAKDLESNVNKR